MARQAALLLLTVHGYEIPAYAVSNDFYRQALDLDLRSKREYHRCDFSARWAGSTRGTFINTKRCFGSPMKRLELADRHDIDEKKLRYVVPMPAEYHEEIVRQIIDFNLTSKQVKELCEGAMMQTMRVVTRQLTCARCKDGEDRSDRQHNCHAQDLAQAC